MPPNIMYVFTNCSKTPKLGPKTARRIILHRRRLPSYKNRAPHGGAKDLTKIVPEEEKPYNPYRNHIETIYNPYKG